MVEADGHLHSYPLWAGHVLNGRQCWCKPDMGLSSSGLVVVEHFPAVN